MSGKKSAKKEAVAEPAPSKKGGLLAYFNKSSSASPVPSRPSDNDSPAKVEVPSTPAKSDDSNVIELLESVNKTGSPSLLKPEGVEVNLITPTTISASSLSSDAQPKPNFPLFQPGYKAKKSEEWKGDADTGIAVSSTSQSSASTAVPAPSSLGKSLIKDSSTTVAIADNSAIKTEEMEEESVLMDVSDSDSEHVDQEVEQRAEKPVENSLLEDPENKTIDADVGISGQEEGEVSEKKIKKRRAQEDQREEPLEQNNPPSDANDGRRRSSRISAATKTFSFAEASSSDSESDTRRHKHSKIDSLRRQLKAHARGARNFDHRQKTAEDEEESLRTEEERAARRQQKLAEKEEKEAQRKAQKEAQQQKEAEKKALRTADIFISKQQKALIAAQKAEAARLQLAQEREMRIQQQMQQIKQDNDTRLRASLSSAKAFDLTLDADAAADPRQQAEHAPVSSFFASRSTSVNSNSNNNKSAVTADSAATSTSFPASMAEDEGVYLGLSHLAASQHLPAALSDHVSSDGRSVRHADGTVHPLPARTSSSLSPPSRGVEEVEVVQIDEEDGGDGADAGDGAEEEAVDGVAYDLCDALSLRALFSDVGARVLSRRHRKEASEEVLDLTTDESTASETSLPPPTLPQPLHEGGSEVALLARWLRQRARASMSLLSPALQQHLSAMLGDDHAGLPKTEPQKQLQTADDGLVDSEEENEADGDEEVEFDVSASRRNSYRPSGGGGRHRNSRSRRSHYDYDDEEDEVEDDDEDIDSDDDLRRHKRSKSNRRRSSRSSYNDEDEDDEDKNSNVLLLLGDSGSYKTALVHQLARASGFNVLEISNASSARTGSLLKRQLLETRPVSATATATATAANNVNAAGGVSNGTPGNSASSSTTIEPPLHLLLIDEADLVLCADSDASFHSSLLRHVFMSQCPVVLTMQRLPKQLHGLLQHTLPRLNLSSSGDGDEQTMPYAGKMMLLQLLGSSASSSSRLLSPPHSISPVATTTTTNAPGAPAPAADVLAALKMQLQTHIHDERAANHSMQLLLHSSVHTAALPLPVAHPSSLSSRAAEELREEMKSHLMGRAQDVVLFDDFLDHLRGSDKRVLPSAAHDPTRVDASEEVPHNAQERLYFAPVVHDVSPRALRLRYPAPSPSQAISSSAFSCSQELVVTGAHFLQRAASTTERHSCDPCEVRVYVDDCRCEGLRVVSDHELRITLPPALLRSLVSSDNASRGAAGSGADVDSSRVCRVTVELVFEVAAPSTSSTATSTATSSSYRTLTLRSDDTDNEDANAASYLYLLCSAAAATIVDPIAATGAPLSAMQVATEELSLLPSLRSRLSPFASHREHLLQQQQLLRADASTAASADALCRPRQKKSDFRGGGRNHLPLQAQSQAGGRRGKRGRGVHAGALAKRRRGALGSAIADEGGDEDEAEDEEVGQEDEGEQEGEQEGDEGSESDPQPSEEEAREAAPSSNEDTSAVQSLPDDSHAPDLELLENRRKMLEEAEEQRRALHFLASSHGQTHPPTYRPPRYLVHSSSHAPSSSSSSASLEALETHAAHLQLFSDLALLAPDTHPYGPSASDAFEDADSSGLCDREASRKVLRREVFRGILHRRQRRLLQHLPCWVESPATAPAATGTRASSSGDRSAPPFLQHLAERRHWQHSLRHLLAHPWTHLLALHSSAVCATASSTTSLTLPETVTSAGVVSGHRHLSSTAASSSGGRGGEVWRHLGVLIRAQTEAAHRRQLLDLQYSHSSRSRRSSRGGRPSGGGGVSSRRSSGVGGLGGDGQVRRSARFQLEEDEDDEMDFDADRDEISLPCDAQFTHRIATAYLKALWLGTPFLAASAPSSVLSGSGDLGDYLVPAEVQRALSIVALQSCSACRSLS